MVTFMAHNNEVYTIAGGEEDIKEVLAACLFVKSKSIYTMMEEISEYLTPEHPLHPDNLLDVFDTVIDDVVVDGNSVQPMFALEVRK